MPWPPHTVFPALLLPPSHGTHQPRPCPSTITRKARTPPHDRPQVLLSRRSAGPSGRAGIEQETVTPEPTLLATAPPAPAREGESRREAWFPNPLLPAPAPLGRSGLQAGLAANSQEEGNLQTGRQSGVPAFAMSSIILVPENLKEKKSLELGLCWVERRFFPSLWLQPCTFMEPRQDHLGKGCLVLTPGSGLCPTPGSPFPALPSAALARAP